MKSNENNVGLEHIGCIFLQHKILRVTSHNRLLDLNNGSKSSEKTWLDDTMAATKTNLEH